MANVGDSLRRLCSLQLGSNSTLPSHNCHSIYLSRCFILYDCLTCIIVLDFTGIGLCAFSALTVLVGPQEGQKTEKTEWWGAGVVICLERGADLHMAQLMPLLLTVSCFSKIQTGFYLSGTGSPG